MKTDTLHGGREVTVAFETPAEPMIILVRQIPVRDYPRGFKLVEDEAALVGFLVFNPAPKAQVPDPWHPRAWAETLTPESYEAVLATGREVNEKGFFAYCGRQAKAAQAKMQDMIASMANLPPDVLQIAMQQGLKSPSQTTWPR